MKVLLSGYYGFGNAGDELILGTIINELQAKNKDIQITVLSSNPKLTRRYHKVKSINRWNFPNIILSILNSDIVVSGGGGLFQDTTGSLSLYYYLLIILLSKLFLRKVFLYSVSVNNLKYLNRIIAGFTFKLVDKITVRDKFSYDLVTKWGFDKNKVQITADPVFMKHSTFNELKTNKPILGFILRSSSDDNLLIPVYAALADLLIRHLFCEIAFIPFQTKKDILFLQKIAGSMNTTSKVIEWKQTDELFSIFSRLDMVISQRLHGLILASLYGLPMIGISNDSKLKDFLNEIGQKHVESISKENINYIFELTIDTWNNQNDSRQRLEQALPPLKERAKLTSEIFVNSFC